MADGRCNTTVIFDNDLSLLNVARESEPFSTRDRSLISLSWYLSYNGIFSSPREGPRWYRWQLTLLDLLRGSPCTACAFFIFIALGEMSGPDPGDTDYRFLAQSDKTSGPSIQLADDGAMQPLQTINSRCHLQATGDVLWTPALGWHVVLPRGEGLLGLWMEPQGINSRGVHPQSRPLASCSSRQNSSALAHY